ncbi:Monocarboxylate transporter 12 [Trichinella sp. T8]|nr:Monocarboxylate transporter 12 [Trichinella sp. T8]
MSKSKDTDNRENVPKVISRDVDVLVEDFVSVPPDGGWGWMIVLSCFFISIIADGSVFAFGILFPEWHSYFKCSTVTVAWVGSLLSGTYLLVGPFAGGLMNRFGARAVIITGSVIMCLAYVMSAFATSVVFLMITYGFIGGIGCGLAYIPSVVYVGYYFEKRRAIATGIAMAGSGLGAVVMPPLYIQIIDTYAWRGGMLILAGLMLQCAVFGSLMRPLPAPRYGSDEETAILQSQRLWNNKFEGEQLHGQTDGVVQKEGSKLVAAGGDGIRPLLYQSQGTLSRVASQSMVRLSVRDYVKSVSQLGSVSSVNKRSAAEALRSCLSTVDPKEFNRPFSRQDILYQGSILRLPLYQQSQENLELYRSGIISVPRLLDAVETTDGYPVYVEHVRFKFMKLLPQQIRTVLGDMFDFSLLRNPVMLILAASNFFALVGFYVPFVYTASYAEYHGIDKTRASYILSSIGFTNVAGRVIVGWMSDRSWAPKALTICNVSLIICGLLTVLYPFMTSFSLMLIYALLFGLIICGFVTLTSIALVDELGLDNLTNSYGLMMMFRGFATLIGSPLAGAMLDATGNYTASFVFAGLLIALAGLVSFLIPVLDYFDLRKPLHKKDDDQVTKVDLDTILENLAEENN